MLYSKTIIVSIFSVRVSGTTGANQQVHDILFVEKPAFFVAHIFFSIKNSMFPDILRIKCCQRSLDVPRSPAHLLGVGRAHFIGAFRQIVHVEEGACSAERRAVGI